MIKAGRVVALAMGLTACQDLDVIDNFMPDWAGNTEVSYWSDSDCRGNDPELVAKADWDKARVITMRIRQGEYDPMIISLHIGKAYALRISNGDDVTRSFIANEFFGEAVAFKSVTANGLTDTGCIGGLVLPAQASAEIQFVAARDGRYDFSGVTMIAGTVPQEMVSGMIIVDP